MRLLRTPWCVGSVLAAIAALLLAAPAPALEIRVQDAAGQPVPEAVVEAAPLDGPGEAQELAAGTGVAALETPGRYLLTVRALGYVTWTGEATVPGEPLAVRLEAGAGLTGLVRDDEGKPVPEVRLELRPRKEGVPPVFLAADPGGQYHVEGIAPGIWRLSAGAPGRVSWFREGIELRAGRIERANVTLRRGCALQLLVSGSDGMPVENAEIFAAPPLPADVTVEGEGWEEPPPVATNAQGRATFGPIPRGQKVRIGLRHPASAPRSLELTPLAGEESREVTLPPGGVLRVIVTDEQDQPVAGARVVLRPLHGRDTDLALPPPPSGADGVLLVGPLPAGEYSLRVEAEGFQPSDLGRATIVSGVAKSFGVLLER
jgi:hypothetical protein